jgi:hypothetical protein
MAERDQREDILQEIDEAASGKGRPVAAEEEEIAAEEEIIANEQEATRSDEELFLAEDEDEELVPDDEEAANRVDAIYSVVQEEAEPEKAAQEPIPQFSIQDPQKIVVTGLDIPFPDLVLLIIKVFLAAIPAAAVLGIIAALIALLTSVVGFGLFNLLGG